MRTFIAELLIPAPNIDALDAMLDVYDTQRSALPWACAGLAAQAFLSYRRSGGTRLIPLPDFYIGAHAAATNLSVLSRDLRLYRKYFPRLRCTGPDTQT
ncbi:type II toxin-antitoxin system VapC family toxin [Allopusillimonas soli]|uniref:PIN domain-containing protein n=1 Tax=Allopusillimonas soli TaxID=659016 RepID=A0A853F6Q7_9BURK|nr:hypothetical protein [Allopusillimonas soli]NYT35773.1 hypothetical protein [Allopusillimonas soli]